jgi:hypothetical protein
MDAGLGGIDVGNLVVRGDDGGSLLTERNLIRLTTFGDGVGGHIHTGDIIVSVTDVKSDAKPAYAVINAVGDLLIDGDFIVGGDFAASTIGAFGSSLSELPYEMSVSTGHGGLTGNITITGDTILEAGRLKTSGALLNFNANAGDITLGGDLTVSTVQTSSQSVVVLSSTENITIEGDTSVTTSARSKSLASLTIEAEEDINMGGDIVVSTNITSPFLDKFATASIISENGTLTLSSSTDPLVQTNNGSVQQRVSGDDRNASLTLAAIEIISPAPPVGDPPPPPPIDDPVAPPVGDPPPPPPIDDPVAPPVGDPPPPPPVDDPVVPPVDDPDEIDDPENVIINNPALTTENPSIADSNDLNCVGSILDQSLDSDGGSYNNTRCEVFSLKTL